MKKNILYILAVSIFLLIAVLSFVSLIDKIDTRLDNIEKKMDEYKLQQDSIASAVLLRKKVEKLANIEIPKKFTDKHIRTVYDECKKNGVPVGLAIRLIQKESSFNKNAKSSVGAKGFMQIMPRTYKHYAKVVGINKHDEIANIKVGIHYIGIMFKYWDKRYDSKSAWKLALASYNVGIGKVGKQRNYYLSGNAHNSRYINFIMNYERG